MRFLLNQKAFTADDKVLYELILEDDYTEGLKPSDASEALADKTPTNTALGSTALYITFIDGKRIQWKFEYQQTAVDEEGWVIVEVLDGGVAPVPLEVTENATYEGNGATGYTPVEVNVEGGGGDFGVASLTFVCSVDSYLVDGVPALDEESGVSVENYNVTEDNPITVSVPLYKGIFYLPSDNFKNIAISVMPTWSGDVDIDTETGNFVITGDGSITCAGTGIL